MLNEITFHKHMTILSEACRSPMSEAQLDVYYMVLSKLTDVEFKQAIATILETREYPSLPMPAEILKAVKGDESDKVAMITVEIESEMQRTAAHRVPSLSKEAKQVVSMLGGWHRICTMDINDWKFERKRIDSLVPLVNSNQVLPKLDNNVAQLLSRIA